VVCNFNHTPNFIGGETTDNNGNNMIPLSDSGMDSYQPVHKMLLHSSGHRNYTAHVQEELDITAKELEKRGVQINPSNCKCRYSK